MVILSALMEMGNTLGAAAGAGKGRGAKEINLRLTLTMCPAGIGHSIG